MKKRFYSVLVSVLFAFGVAFSGSCIQDEDIYGEKYNRLVTEDQFKQMNDLIVTVDITTKYRIGEDREDEKKMKGIGLKINDNSFIFLKHVVESPQNVTVRTSFGIFHQPVFPLSHEILLNGKELEVVDTEYDIALLKYKDSKLYSSFDVPVADINDVKIGNVVYIIGFSGGVCRNFKFGNISYFFENHDELNLEGGSEKYHERIIMLNIPTYPGDSGSCVFVMNKRTGKMEIIGIIGLKGVDNVGLAYRIDDIVESIEKMITDYQIDWVDELEGDLHE